ncbi:hypothetical protein CTAYLR_010210 [Chrysophaeum taylorii]|uniref:Protein farnesyltransferase/geranylgeranyltransferase type-1 subunit alpha n=1 Tax=Chrysophaeum taylorii TaxID=2483200 RepID=A0AAD7UK04_9STRA|nr:hypothetical protein CTAYLR_010210 [Chrysophaeum taylorii]
MNYFRAIRETGERSARVLALTAEILEYNAAHYTVWSVRRQCLYSLGEGLLEDELDYSEMVASSNPKNYQIWYHRRDILEKMSSTETARRELEFIARMLASDAKNYHAWSHRLWVLKRFECWDRELLYVDALLDEDAWNNSAWNHRYAVATRLSLSPEAEVAYAVKRASLAPRNEAPWVYALAVARLDSPDALSDLRAACEALLVDEIDPPDRACARMTLVDLDADLDTPEALHKAADHATKLAEDEDAFRAKYWTRRAQTLQDRAKNLLATTK